MENLEPREGADANDRPKFFEVPSGPDGYEKVRQGICAEYGDAWIAVPEDGPNGRVWRVIRLKHPLPPVRPGVTTYVYSPDNKILKMIDGPQGDADKSTD